MVKSLLRPLFKSRASGMMPNLTPGAATSLLPVGGLYYDITQERFPNDVTEDITTDIENAMAAGSPLPAFARGASKMAMAAMAQRGLSASTIAADAVAEGVLRACLLYTSDAADE